MIMVSGRENVTGRDVRTLTATGSWAKSSTRPRLASPRSPADSRDAGQERPTSAKSHRHTRGQGGVCDISSFVPDSGSTTVW